MLTKIIKESRPATLVVSLLSTSLGIITAFIENYLFKNYLWDIWRIILITIAGLLLQSGVNLINNFFEEDVAYNIMLKRTHNFLGFKRTKDEILIFKAGLLFFLITAVIGLYLTYYTGLKLLVIELIGLFSAYAYAGKPFNYKKLGLGSLMSFIMMGPLLVYASYIVFSGHFSLLPLLYSFTMGLFIPAILLANELRDYEEDRTKNIYTLTVRIGYNNGKLLYYGLIIISYINVIILVFLKYLPSFSIIVLSTIPLLKKIPYIFKSERKLLVPLTAKLYLFFGIQLLITLVTLKIL